MNKTDIMSPRSCEMALLEQHGLSERDMILEIQDLQLVVKK